MLKFEDFEKRLIRLEEDSCFQEEKLIALERQINEMEKLVSGILNKQEEITNILAQLHLWLEKANRSASGEHEIPPHYGPEKW